MRIAGYVRQAPGLSDSDTAFAQSERVRRWVRDTGNELIAICQDHQDASRLADRPGFKALLSMVRSGGVDAVLLATLSALSPDKILQEIMIEDLRSTGTGVISVSEEDLALLQDGGDDHTRIVVRDVVARVAEYHEEFGLTGTEVWEFEDDDEYDPPEMTPSDTTDMVVRLIAPAP